MHLDHFSHLPDELRLQILEFLGDPFSILNVCAVNKQYHCLAKDDSLWKTLFIRERYERTLNEEKRGTSYFILFRRQFISGA